MGKSSLSVGTQGWSARINEAYRHSAESVLEVGRLLLECKKTVHHGDFENMIKHDLDFEVRTAQRLMAIAKDRRLSNATNLSFLPRAVSALFEMTKLDDDAFNAALATGDINPKATRKEVAKLRAPAKAPIIIDITPSADEADTPAETVSQAASVRGPVPGSAVPERPDHEQAGHHHAADHHEVEDSDDPTLYLDEASVFEAEPGSLSAVAVALNPISAAIEFAKRVSVDDFFADLDVTIAHEDVYGFSNWILELKDLVKAAKQIEEAEAAA